MTDIALRPSRAESTWRAPLLLWLLAGLVILASLPLIPMNRTQEARVLATAREMLDADLRGWLIPHLNGQVRLQKPPLAYWLTAASYQLFGVSAWAGRIPMAITGWFTIAVAYCAARRVFNPQVALFAGIAMVGNFLFLRYSRLAETDVLSALFVTTAIDAFWRMDDHLAQGDPRSRRAAVAWAHWAGASIALAILGKGPPGAFPALFLLGLCAVHRSGQPLFFWLRSLAPLTLLLIAAPWFVYVSAAPQAGIIEKEFEKVLEGGGHIKPFWYHLLILAETALPWTALLIAALIAAIPRWRDRRLGLLLLWAACILIPLSAIGQKQEHYQFPLMPPLMILTAWMVDRSLSGEDSRLTAVVRLIFWGMLVTGLAGAVLLPVLGSRARGEIVPLDLVTAGILASVALLAILLSLGSLKRLAYGTLLAGAGVMLTILGFWAPTVEQEDHAGLAQTILAQHGEGPFAFHPSPIAPLIFHLRQVIPVYDERRELNQALRSNPDLIVIVEREPEKIEKPLPDLQRLGSYLMDEKLVEVYRAPHPDARASAPPPPPGHSLLHFTRF